MTVDVGQPWGNPGAYWPAIARATAELDPPFGVLHRGALAHNAHDLVRRAQGVPIRVASKSLRVRGVLEAVLALPGFAGVLGYTLTEAIWLARHGIDDIVIAYPTADRGALAELAADEELASRITIMVDDVAQLDLVDTVVPPSRRAKIRVAVELDASLRAPVLGHVGVYRSPIRHPAALGELAAAIVGRPGFALVGIMVYEAQIAGVSNAGPQKAAVRAMQRVSIADVAERRSRAVSLVRSILRTSDADLEFVNSGGTGSIESTRLDESVTEIAAGSGLFGPHIFDHYTAFTPAPAVGFALSVVRRPAPRIATLLGGGWVASGPPGVDRLPIPVWPPGLEFVTREAAGEVQSPVRGDAADSLRVGDRVWLRHAKSGEVSEHVNELHVVDGNWGDHAAVAAELPTYRGEGKAFL
ncbi:alanine racemase [Leucobacter sp. NPDC058333]|uniref:alanine racemase n=1 Tax=Leucobacter sp. NPDC058333 TaxID=3346450 RepID=UPI003651E910